MALQIQIDSIAGETSPTLDLYASTADAVITGGDGLAATEVATRLGTYRATTTAAAGTYWAKLVASDGAVLSDGEVILGATDPGIYVVGEITASIDAIPTTAMRGTDSAALASALTTAQSDLDIITGASGVNLLTATQSTLDAILVDTAEIGAAGAGLTNVTLANDLSATMKTSVQTAVDAAIDTAIAELSVAAPTATPTLRTGLMLLYMALRNKLVVQTSGTDALEVYNDAGTKIAAKLLTDDGSDYEEAKLA